MFSQKFARVLFSRRGLLAMALSSALLASGAPAFAAPPAVAETNAAALTVVDRIVAVIDTDIITLRELHKQAAAVLEKTAPAKHAEALRRVLDIKIDEKLMSIEVAKAGDRLVIAKADIDKAVDEVLRRNNMSNDQLKTALYGQGVTWSEYRGQLRSQLQRARLINARLQGRVDITMEDARVACAAQKESATEQQLCASHILLKVGPGVKGETVRARAVQLQSEVRAGGDFSAYALKHSEDKSSADGSLGCFSRGEMVEAFETAAFKTPTGEISDVVRTEFGYHIIKVNSRKQDSSSCTSEAVLNGFRNELYGREVEKQTALWMKELRRSSFVDVRL